MASVCRWRSRVHHPAVAQEKAPVFDAGAPSLMTFHRSNRAGKYLYVRVIRLGVRSVLAQKEGRLVSEAALTLLAFFVAERSVWLYGLSGQSGSF